MRFPLRSLAVGLSLLCLPACGDGGAPSDGGGGGAKAEPVPITNRIDIPSSVRKNLGITFATVAPRDVQHTIRVPGRFELRAEAHRAYHVALDGQVELAVTQYTQVKKGDLLFHVESPAWRGMQKELADTVLAIQKALAEHRALKQRVAAVGGHAAKLRDQRTIWQERLTWAEKLGTAGGGNATARHEARAGLAAAETALAEVVEEVAELHGIEVSIRARLAGHQGSTPLLFAEATGATVGAKAPRDLALARAAALLGVSVAHLREPVAVGGISVARWHTIDRLRVHAKQDGIVESLAVTDGGWIEAGATVLETADPTLLRFRASGLQADLGRLKDDLVVRVLPPGGDAVAAADALVGTMTIGIEADPLGRKIDLIMTPKPGALPHWARPGVSTEMEVVLAKTGAASLAIPLGSVIQDGLDKIIFRRDPKDANKVIRLKADLGVTDGRWVVIESGLMEGDEVVHHGVYELMLASGGAKQMGGHFHSDGTFHEGPDH